MAVKKRSRTDIYLDVLDLLCKEGGRTGKASPTRVARRANLSYVRFQKILKHLVDVGMVRFTDSGILVTQRGINCLSQLREVNSLLSKVGLDF
ncbi:MAG: winged helix-turn-helix domain-containing protein [Candidatus Bathyarchaeota archaeon]|nr:winged helix-turn-helix domain-containing protein [Candidatus Bathyarchaeota archaeon]